MTNYLIKRECEEKKFNFEFSSPKFDVAENMFWSAVKSSKEIIGDYTITMMKCQEDYEHELISLKKTYD